MDKTPLVSIIIPTYNSGKTLGLCLESIKNQTYPNIETIVVDNFSRDNTPEICKWYGARLIQVKGERAKAKNIGTMEARGKYVLFVDSDMELTPKVVEECVTLMESDPKIGGIVIPERSVGDSYWVKVRDFERQFYAGTSIESARFFRRELVLKVGGFDENVVFFEESTLPQKIEKLGYDVWARISAPILHHEEGFSLRKWLRKKYYYGQTAREYKRKYHEFGSKQISALYRFGLFFKNKRFWSRPHLAIGVITLKLLEYVAAGGGYMNYLQTDKKR